MGVWVIMEFKVGKCLGKVIEISFRKRTQRRKNGDLSFEEFLKVVAPRLRDKTSREEVFKVFKLFDEDNTGRISFKNLRKISAEVGESIGDDELHEMISEADRTGDGLITFEDFYRVMKKRHDDPLGEFDSDDEDEDGDEY